MQQSHRHFKSYYMPMNNALQKSSGTDHKPFLPLHYSRQCFRYVSLPHWYGILSAFLHDYVDWMIQYFMIIYLVLIQTGTDINETDTNGRTALHFAAQSGFCVSTLISAGADVNILTNDGMWYSCNSCICVNMCKASVLQNPCELIKVKKKAFLTI